MNVSVMTNILHIYPPNITKFQNDYNLSPKLWLYKDVNVKNDVMELIHKSSEEFQKYRRQFIYDRLAIINNENIHRIEDDVSEEIKTNKRIKVSKTSRQNIDIYSFCESYHTGKSNLQIGEPLMENPCSYKSVENVLRHIQHSTIKGDRLWTMVGCDGLPFVLGTNIIKESEDLQNLLMLPGHGHIELNMTRGIIIFINSM